MYSRYVLQLCRCSLIPHKVGDSCAHAVQHLRGMPVMVLRESASEERTSLRCGRRTRRVTVAASEYSNNEYGMDGVL